MKRIHKAFEKLGYDCLTENRFGVTYAKDYGSYRHIIQAFHQSNGGYLVKSCEEEFNSDGRNNVIGMTPKELKLIVKAAHRMSRKYKWRKKW